MIGKELIVFVLVDMLATSFSKSRVVCRSGTYSKDGNCEECPSTCGGCEFDEDDNKLYCTSLSNSQILQPLYVAIAFLGTMFLIRATVAIVNKVKSRGQPNN